MENFVFVVVIIVRLRLMAVFKLHLIHLMVFLSTRSNYLLLYYCFCLFIYENLNKKLFKIKYHIIDDKFTKTKEKAQQKEELNVGMG